MPTLEEFVGYIGDRCVAPLQTQQPVSWQSVYNETFKTGLQLRTRYGQSTRSSMVLNRLFEWIIVHK